MNTKKGSKNAVSNRNARSVKTCGKCGEEKKTLKVLELGKSKIAYECKCGILDSNGNSA